MNVSLNTRVRYCTLLSLQKQDIMAASRLTMPWEYHVCSGCFRENPYAIWLIKQQCFEPHQHKQHRTSKVVVDETSMAMVRIRPLPANYNQIKGYYILCHHYKQHGYHYDLKCPFAHSDLERNMWNIKKRILGKWLYYMKYMFVTI